MTSARGPALGLVGASLLVAGGALLLPRQGSAPSPPVAQVTSAAPAPAASAGRTPSGWTHLEPPGAGFAVDLPPSVQPQVHRLDLRRVLQLRRGRRPLLQLDSAPLLPWIRAADLPVGGTPWVERGTVDLPGVGLRFDFGGEAWVWIARPRVLLLVGAGRLVQVTGAWRHPDVARILRTYRAVPGAGLRDLGGAVLPDAREQVEAARAALGEARVAKLPRALRLGLERLPSLDVRDASILLRHLRASTGQPGPTSRPAAAAAPQACARCHRLPPPSLLPRGRWAKAIGDMTRMPAPPGVRPLSAAEVGQAIAWFTARALAELPVRPPSPAPDGRFPPRPETPRALRVEAPAVTHVSIDRGVVSVLDARTESLLRWAKGRWTRVAGGLSAPARLAPYGSDGALVIACLGTVDPTDRRVGSVRLLPAGGDQSRVVAKDLGRTSDVEPGDLDGDGDLDLVVAAFGFRTPGGLELLLRGPGEAFTRRTLDARDGFVHAAPVDLDGDGRLDVVALLAQEHEQVVWFRGEGGGRFAAPRVVFQAPHPGWGYSGMRVVDLDRDGDPDLLVTNGDSLDNPDLLRADHGVSWLENLGQGRFAHHRIGLLYGATCAVPGDLDGDGDLDVAACAFLPLVPAAEAAAKRLDSVVWFERREGAWIRHAVEQGRCVHASLAIGDVSGDGRPDIVAGNFAWKRAGARDQPLLTVFTQR